MSLLRTVDVMEELLGRLQSTPQRFLPLAELSASLFQVGEDDDPAAIPEDLNPTPSWPLPVPLGSYRVAQLGPLTILAGEQFVAAADDGGHLVAYRRVPALASSAAAPIATAWDTLFLGGRYDAGPEFPNWARIMPALWAIRPFARAAPDPHAARDATHLWGLVRRGATKRQRRTLNEALKRLEERLVLEVRPVLVGATIHRLRATENGLRLRGQCSGDPVREVACLDPYRQSRSWILERCPSSDLEHWRSLLPLNANGFSPHSKAVLFQALSRCAPWVERCSALRFDQAFEVISPFVSPSFCVARGFEELRRQLASMPWQGMEADPLFGPRRACAESLRISSELSPCFSVRELSERGRELRRELEEQGGCAVLPGMETKGEASLWLRINSLTAREKAAIYEEDILRSGRATRRSSSNLAFALLQAGRPERALVYALWANVLCEDDAHAQTALQFITRALTALLNDKPRELGPLLQHATSAFGQEAVHRNLVNMNEALVRGEPERAAHAASNAASILDTVLLDAESERIQADLVDELRRATLPLVDDRIERGELHEAWALHETIRTRSMRLYLHEANRRALLDRREGWRRLPVSGLAPPSRPMLGPHGVALTWHRGTREGVFVHRGEELRFVPLSLAPLPALLTRLDRGIERRSRAAHSALRELDRLLLEPLEELLEGADTIWIASADEALHSVPWAALGAESRNARSTVAVVATWASDLAAPSSDAVHWLSGQTPGLEAEAAILRNRLGTRLLPHRSMPPAPKGWMSISAHATFNEDDPLKSTMALDGGSVTAEDLYGIDLSGVPCAVVNTCVSARHGAIYATDLFGLLRGFFVAGAASVVGTSWNLHGKSAVCFADGFWAAVAEGATPGQAYRAGVNHTRACLPHPYFWAGFQLFARAPALLGSQEPASPDSQHRWVTTESAQSGRVGRETLSRLEATSETSDPSLVGSSTDSRGHDTRLSSAGEGDLSPGIRRCVDCGRPTGNWCDGCEHLNVMDYPPFPNRPFCTVCEDKHGVCRHCRLV
ncbi:MAG: CHAT domain-containing protein [Pseudomonadota bacterium]